MRRLICLSLVLIASASALAQQQSPTQQPAGLTWIRYYEALPGKEAELGQLLISSTRSAMDKLIADKIVAAYGIVVPLSYNTETWTHAVYITVADWTSYEAFRNGVMAAHMALPPADIKKVEEGFRAALRPHSNRDVMLRHVSQAPLPAAPPSARPKYIGIDYYTIKPGRFEDATGLFNEWAKPLFTGVASTGKFGPWGLSTQEMVTMPGWTHMVWYFMSDLGVLDQLNAATMALGPMKLKGYDVRLRDMSEPEKHSGQLLRIVHQAP